MENNPQSEQPREDLITGYVDEMRQMEIVEHQAAVKKARNMLFVVAVLVFIGEMVSMFAGPDPGFSIFILVVALVEAGIFVALAFWTHKKPYQAIVGGLVAFIGILLLSAVANGYVDGVGGALKSIASGIIIKIAVLVALVRALGNARKLQHFQQETF